jgi:hypothetical protein
MQKHNGAQRHQGLSGTYRRCPAGAFHQDLVGTWRPNDSNICSGLSPDIELGQVVRIVYFHQLVVPRKKMAQQCREISGPVVEHVRFSTERKVDPVFDGIEPTVVHIRLYRHDQSSHSRWPDSM